MNTRTLLLKATKELKAAGVPDPEYDSAILLARVMDAPPLQLRLGLTEEPTKEELAEFRRLMDRRVAREPLQYIEGKTVFNFYEYTVRPGVLIPRPETALLANWAGRWLMEWFFFHVPHYEPDEERFPWDQLPHAQLLDLCCGSGCLGLSASVGDGPIDLTMTDLSPEALEVARENARYREIPCEILQGDLFEAVQGRKFDLIVSNPPYIPSEECDHLQAEVMHEPRMALDGGVDGLDFYRRIIQEVPDHLRPDGALMMEMGMGQVDAIRKMLEDRGANYIEVKKDDQGIQRMILAEFGQHRFDTY
ncbi:MAG: peptide chain release factor N(5)-glutamine methyltransferase [Clostridia bacterium]|nr:peptide chain release factor N(5)-glutamine methyltransferase [Clostridia bacterium]